MTPQLWRGEFDVAVRERFKAEDLLHSDVILKQWLRATKRDGLSIVEGLADTVETGKAIAERVGQLRKTNSCRAAREHFGSVPLP